MRKAPTRQWSGPFSLSKTHWTHDPNQPDISQTRAHHSHTKMALRMASRATHGHRDATPETYWPGENKQLGAINGHTQSQRKIQVS